MRVQVDRRGGPGSELQDLQAWHYPEDTHVVQYLLGLSEHDLADIEYVLAARRAMSKSCGAVRQEHTCWLSPGHAVPEPSVLRLVRAGEDRRTERAVGPGSPHECRACPHTWVEGA